MNIKIKGRGDSQYAPIAGVTAFMHSRRTVPAGLYRDKITPGTAQLRAGVGARNNYADVTVNATAITTTSAFSVSPVIGDEEAGVAPRQRWEEVDGLYVMVGGTIVTTKLLSTVSYVNGSAIMTKTAHGCTSGDLYTAYNNSHGFSSTEIYTLEVLTANTFQLIKSDGLILTPSGTTTTNLGLITPALPEGVHFVVYPYSLHILA